MTGQYTKRVLVVTIAAAALAVGADAQGPASNRTLISKTIDFRAARNMAAPPRAQIQAIEQKVSAAPATEAASPSHLPVPPTPVPAETQETERGKLYHVELQPSEETALAKELASQKAIQAQGTALITIPGIYKQLAIDGTELLLKPFVIPQRLSLNATTGRFVGSIKIGVHEIGGPAPARQLSAPIEFQVAEDDVATPDKLTVTHSGLPLSPVRIAALDAPNGLSLTVVSPFEPNGTNVVMPLAPEFTLSVSKSIQGLGLEAGTVIVAARGLEKPEGRKVTLTVDGSARLETMQLQLDKDGNASTTIRSVGTGNAVVHASLAGFRPIQASLALTVPYLTIAASALGGLAGGLIRLLPALRRGATRRFTIGLAVALLVGMIVFGLYAVGVNVLPIQPTVKVGAVLVLVVSALGGFFGPGVLGGAAPPQASE